MNPSAKIVNGWQLLTIFAKSSILAAWKGFEYVSVLASNELAEFATKEVKFHAATQTASKLTFLHSHEANSRTESGASFPFSHLPAVD